MSWKEDVLLILDDNNNSDKKEALDREMTTSPPTLRMLKSYIRRNFVLPVLASSCFLVLLWLLLLNSRQERHLKQVVADERARQYYLAASDGADLKENFTVCSTQWKNQVVLT